MSRENGQSSLRKRRVTLSDGRYLIFYTFEKHAPSASSDKETGAKKAEPGLTVPQAEEERLV